MDDPRQIPYLLIWRDRFDWGIREALKLSKASDHMIEVPTKQIDAYDRSDSSCG